MLRIGIIGLGSIARKAYLPVLADKSLDLHLFSRDQAKSKHLAMQYRWAHAHDSLQSVIDAGIQGAFVHAATAAHYALIEPLLNHGIHVYVDKPLTDSYQSTKELIDLATARNVTLMVGFNRRYAPAYQRAMALPDPDMVIMQKNRYALPGPVRSFVFDDFIHVVDTLLSLFTQEIVDIQVNGKIVDNLLHHLAILLKGKDNGLAIGIMNRNSSHTEERLEVTSATEKCVVENVTDITLYNASERVTPTQDDWASTLFKRGFDQIVDAFLQVVETGVVRADLQSLRTHELCEQIVQQLNTKI